MKIQAELRKLEKQAGVLNPKGDKILASDEFYDIVLAHLKSSKFKSAINGLLRDILKDLRDKQEIEQRDIIVRKHDGGNFCVPLLEMMIGEYLIYDEFYK